MELDSRRGENPAGSYVLMRDLKSTSDSRTCLFRTKKRSPRLLSTIFRNEQQKSTHLREAANKSQRQMDHLDPFYSTASCNYKVGRRLKQRKHTRPTVESMRVNQHHYRSPHFLMLYMDTPKPRGNRVRVTRQHTLESHDSREI